VSWDKFGAQLMPPAFIRQIFLTDLVIEVGWAERRHPCLPTLD